ncbi:MAG: cation:proton antiporter [Candidatus Wallbacteria bacterium]|nr:cation:proton antiporter [Candidatus Wallbacteria bacterium]
MAGSSLFTEIAVILSCASAIGIAGMKFRQPLIIAYLLTGILAGPAGLGIISAPERIEAFAQIGISILLFIVGLKLDPHLVKTTGPVALATGLGQVLFTSIAGFAIAIAFGIPLISSLYLSIALTFSSTIIIVKLLSDKKEIDSLHGRIAVGFLIVQDIIAILAMIGLTSFSSGVIAGKALPIILGGLVLKGGALFLGLFLVTRFVLPTLLFHCARTQELLVVFSISWAVFLGAAAEFLGFSMEVGSFLAGVAMSGTGYRDSIGARLVSVRDFLLLFFFINLGAQLQWSALQNQVPKAVVFSVFVLIGNPLIVMAIMGYMGYRKRTGFLAGLAVAQISEFSLILGALGVKLGHISHETMGLITLVGVVTIVTSTYMILFSGPLYNRLSRLLGLFERSNPYREESGFSGQYHATDLILIGLGSYGSSLADNLLERKYNLMGVDFNPEVLDLWRSRGMQVAYGDAGDPEFHETLPLTDAKWIISTIREPTLNSSILFNLKSRGYTGKVALTAANPQEAQLYQNFGADVVFRPNCDAAEQAIDSLAESRSLLPETKGWPIAFQEFRLKSGSTASGKTINEIPLRSRTGTSIIAVSRAGRIHFDPGPDFRIYPGDRLVLMGLSENINKALSLMQELHEFESQDGERFDLAEIEVSKDSQHAGHSLAELGFRKKYHATVIGIVRDGERMMFPGPSVKLNPGDQLLLIGLSGPVEKLKQQPVI